MSLYKHALERIVQAYDTNGPIPTRLEAAASIRVFSDQLDSRKVYHALSARKRERIKVALIRAFHNLALTSSYEHSALGYAKGLTRLFERACGVAPRGHTEGLQSLMRHIKIMKDHPAYVAFVSKANTMADENPELYTLDSLSALQRKIDRHSTDKPSLSRVLFNRISGHMYAEHIAADVAFDEIVKTFDPQGKDDSINRLYMPPTGPRSAEELFACLLAAYSAVCVVNFPNEDERLELRERIDRLLLNVRGLIMDLNDPQVRSLHEIDLREKVRASRKASILYEIPDTVAIGMTRYFIEHHRDKMSADQRQGIVSELEALYRFSRLRNADRMAHNGFHMNEQDIEASIDKMFRQTWVPVEIPDTDKLLADMIGRMDPKKRQRFQNILASTSSVFEPVVTFYQEQHDHVRKLRRTLFKNAGPRAGQDAYKALFISHLAREQPQLLIDAGFPADTIATMAREGKIPEPESIRLGNLTVDHVIDLHCGGTNNISNLVLMPSHLNKMKNDILLLQTGLLHENQRKTGSWVIVLRPKQDAAGKMPQVLTDNIPLQALNPAFAAKPSVA